MPKLSKPKTGGPLGGKSQKRSHFAAGLSTKSIRRNVVSNRDEAKLKSMVIDWNNYRVYFKKIEKADTDQFTYTLVPKKLDVESE